MSRVAGDGPVVRPQVVPRATYRLQLHPSFTLRDARRLLDYLQELGISDLYLSPVCAAQAGSEHGYNTVDHRVVNPALGGEQAFRELAEDLRSRGMGLMLDVVPNHMGIGDDTNRLWWDVLENGPSSPYAGFFDIDWNPPKTDLANQVLLPVLGDQYGLVLEAGYLRLEYREGAFIVRYFDRLFPIAPRGGTVVLTLVLEAAKPLVPEGDESLAELESVITHLRNLPLRTETDPERIRERQREKEVARRRLEALLNSSAILRALLDETLLRLNGRVGEPHTFDALDELLCDQAYRLCHWRVAADEINYRRFFDVNELAAIRVESPEVFAVAHELVFRLAGEGLVTGLRIDHIDGLHDPEQYLLDLQEGYRSATGRDEDLYVVVEKILAEGERLNPAWRTSGTVGYDFLNDVSGLFVDPARDQDFLELYGRLAGERLPFAEVAHRCKKLILLVALTSEVHVLARKLDRISEQHRWSRDFTASNLKFALREVTASFPVYRTYIRGSAVSAPDRRLVEIAIREAKRRNPATSASVFDFISSVLLMEDPPGLTEAALAARREFAMRFQQLTAPVMAKGVEDTAFYRSYPLASLNEVGGDPEKFGRTMVEFHRQNQERLRDWPHALLSTSTHDTKRGEDTRVRLDALSEIPAEWERTFRRWREINRRHRVIIDGEEVPSANEEYLLYQTLIGTWPFQRMSDAELGPYTDRIEAYMEKALREAKERTSWIKPNEAHDQAIRGYVRALLEPGGGNGFLPDFATFITPLVHAGAWNSLGQVIVKTASPGVPDFYQGTEFWDLSLVDPDNRRPVDFERRIKALDELKGAMNPERVAALARSLADGRLKLLVTSRALDARCRMRALFEQGDYIPIEVAGEGADRVVAFARRSGDQAVVVAVGRFFLKAKGKAAYSKVIGEAWEGMALKLPGPLCGRYRDVVTGRELDLRDASDRSVSRRGILGRLVSGLLRSVVASGAAELPVEELFRDLPVAMLERMEHRS